MFLDRNFEIKNIKKDIKKYGEDELIIVYKNEYEEYKEYILMFMFDNLVEDEEGRWLREIEDDERNISILTLKEAYNMCV